MATEAERAWMERSDDIFDVVADIDPPSRRIRYAFETGYHAAGTEPDDVEHVCANDPLHAQAKIIGQRQEIARLREALTIIARGTWTAKNSIESMVWTAREALKES